MVTGDTTVARAIAHDKRPLSAPWTSCRRNARRLTVSCLRRVERVWTTWTAAAWTRAWLPCAGVIDVLNVELSMQHQP